MKFTTTVDDNGDLQVQQLEGSYSLNIVQATEEEPANSKLNIEGKNYSDIPVWRRYTLTIEEAARYYHIGEGKLRTLIDTHPNEDFYVMNGNRALIKREKFERYLDKATAV